MKKKKFCVIGAGNFGANVARVLFEAGHEVLVIDNNRQHVQEISDHCSVAVLADAADKEFLASQGITEMDAVVIAIGERSHAATLTTLYLKELGVKRLLVKSVNEDHGRILRKVGADEVIYPEKDMAVKVARNLASPNILDMLEMAGGYALHELAPPKGFVGKSLIELDLRRRYNILVLGIKDVLTDEFVLMPEADRKLKDSDVLLVLGKAGDVDRAMKL